MEKKPHLVFVHGAWHYSWYWDENFVPWFKKAGYSVSSFDLSCHAESVSKKQLNKCRLKTYVDDLEKHLSALPADREIIVIAHSMGGMVVQKYLKRKKLDRIVLLASAPANGILRATMKYFFAHPLLTLKMIFTADMKTASSTPELLGQAFYSNLISEDKLAEYYAKRRSESFAVYMAMNFHYLKKKYTRGVDALVIGSDSDFFFSLRNYRYTARKFNTSPVIFKNTPHNCMLGQNWKEIAGTIDKWIAGH